METKELSNLFVISDLFATGGKQAPIKIAISQTGVYTPAFGRPREITGEMFDMMIENFKRNTLGSKLSVYYSHWDSKRAAAAEIKNIYKGVADNSPSKSVLYAEVEWTPKGKKAILDKEYKYISAEFAYNLKRPKDEDESVFEEFGTVLTGVALTNEPAVHDIPAIVFSGNKKFVAQFTKTSEDKKVSLKPEGDLKMNELLKLMGVKDEKEAMEKFSSLTKVIEDFKKEGVSKELSEKDTEIDSLKKEIETMKEDQFSKEKKDFLDGLFNNKKITKEKHDTAMNYNRNEFSVFKDVVSDMKDVLPKPKGSPSLKGAEETPPSIDDYAKKFKPEEINKGVV